MMQKRGRRALGCCPATPVLAAAGLLAAVWIVAAGNAALAQAPPFERIASRYDFKTTVQKLQASVKASQLNIVTRASAQQGAAFLGVKIPGNQVWGLYAPQFAVRMLQASVAAGFEAPIRLYLVEAPDGKVTVRYRKPSLLFKPYGHPDLDAMAAELDQIFAEIVGVVR